MQDYYNPKVIGSIVVGFSLVAGAYLFNSFKEPVAQLPQQASNIQSVTSQKRVSIEVRDEDNNGLEDWRDDFVTTDAVVLNQNADPADYVAPETVTGKMSVELMERMLSSRINGPFGNTDSEIVSKAITSVSEEAVYEHYGLDDIVILSEWEDQDIVNYANTAAATLYRNSVPGIKNELLILQDYLNTKSPESLEQLVTLTNVYKGYLDDTLKIPVPAFLVKEHLDLINTYSAIYQDISAMTLAVEDPILALVRLKRYQDDASGLGYALQNMYFALLDAPGDYGKDDPAGLFTLFDPNYQI